MSEIESSRKYNLSLGMVRRWIKKYNESIELKDYDLKGEVYTMKSLKTTYEERLEIVKWVIENNLILSTLLKNMVLSMRLFTNREKNI